MIQVTVTIKQRDLNDKILLEKLCKAGLDFDFFLDLKEDITLHKICR